MDITITESNDAKLVHELMIQAFMEYKDKTPPSSALEETVESISIKLEGIEQAFICYLHNKPVGMVRFQVKNDYIYFSRLSVIPEKQGLGIAKALLKELEEYAIKKELTKIQCKVRMNVPRNINLYNSVGYKVYDEEIVHKPNGINIKVVAMKKQLIS